MVNGKKKSGIKNEELIGSAREKIELRREETPSCILTVAASVPDLLPFN